VRVTAAELAGFLRGMAEKIEARGIKPEVSVSTSRGTQYPSLSEPWEDNGRREMRLVYYLLGPEKEGADDQG
jgi:hypothetical protein